MKTFNLIAKIVAALAAIAGIIYVVATYGDKIVAWAKNLLAKFGCCGEGCACDCQCDADCENCPCESDCDECPCCDECEEVEEETSEEIPAEEESAEEADFEG